MIEKAKDFNASNHLGQEVSLSSFKGKKIWLAFYRYASCPLCNLHIHSIINRFDEVKNKKLIFLPVFQSPAHEVKKHVGKEDVPFQIICDPHEKLYQLYHVENSYRGFFSFSVIFKMIKAMVSGFLPGKIEGNVSRLPSEFIIDEKFHIVFRYKGKNIGDHPDLNLILEKAK